MEDTPDGPQPISTKMKQCLGWPTLSDAVALFGAFVPRAFKCVAETALQGSYFGYRTWVLAIHPLATSPRGQSSMKL